jgi:hypothetical protein
VRQLEFESIKPKDKHWAPSTKVVNNLFDRGKIRVGEHLISLGSAARAEFAAKAAEWGEHEATPIPQSESACRDALKRYEHYRKHLETLFQDLADERIADPDTQGRIVRELWRLALVSARL